MPAPASKASLAVRLLVTTCFAGCAFVNLTCQSTPASIEPHAAPVRKKATVERRQQQAPARLRAVTITPEVHPLSGLEQGELARMVRDDPSELGSVSIGRPNRGGLFNGVPMPEGPNWNVRAPERSWATREAVESLSRAIRAVANEFANTPRLQIGDMSKKKGGYFRPHRSHQSGCDADIGYYYKEGQGGWYVNADEKNLDVERTWALVKALITPGNVEYIFIDRSVQAILRRYAEGAEPNAEWLDDVFETPGKKGDPIIRHAWGHRTHMHVRFYNERARETSRLAYKLLARYGKI